MRHARAEAFAPDDHARRLTDRGRAEADDAASHLARSGWRPDYALVSSSVRTRESWAAVAGSVDGTGITVSFEDALFTGSVDVVLETLRASPAEASTVILVGHNPTAAYLCHLLDDGDGDPEAVSGLLQGFPPSAVAVLEVAVPWADLAAETGRLVGFYVGRS